MANLRYGIGWAKYDPTDPATQQITVSVPNPARSGTAYARLTRDADAPGAWTALVHLNPGFPNPGQATVFPISSSGTYKVEYRDDRWPSGTLLGKAYVTDDWNGCYNDSNQVLIGAGVDATGKLLINFRATGYSSHFASPDNFVTQKATTHVGIGQTTANWTATELTALGITAQIATIGLRKPDNSCTLVIGGEFQIIVLPAAPMVGSYTKTNVSATGGSDGSITVTVTGGSGNRTISWGDGVTGTLVRNGLTAGTYSVTITDNTSGQVLSFTGIQITQPTPPPIVGSFSHVPTMNSFRFVPEGDTKNQCSIFQNFDNTLLCEEEHPYFAKTNYYNKVNQCDVRTIQIFSDYPSNIVELRRYGSNALITSFQTFTKVSNVDQIETFGIYIKNHGSGQSRVYFNVGAIPIPVVVGNAFTIKNNADGFNGSYTVSAIQNDPLLGSQFLVINKNYAIGAAQTPADGEFTYNIVPFDVVEATCSFASVPIGEYYLRLISTGGGTPRTWRSEPILVDVSHPDTNLIEYRNIDNSFDMVWTTGITCAVRVESWFHNRLTKGKRVVSRNCSGKIVKLAAQKFRRFKLETVQLPPYLHEKLSVSFDCDVIRVNGVEYQTEEDYADPQYKTRYQLANSQIVLEQVEWFPNYNSHDLGTAADENPQFLIVNNGLLRVK